jgi:outer membrane protein TolC
MPIKPIVSLLLLLAGTSAYAQTDTVVMNMSSVLSYAVRHQPGLRASLVNQRIVDYQVKGALSDWLPQVTGSGAAQHYFQPSQSFFPDSLFTPGATGYAAIASTPKNVSTLTLGATQNIYNRDVMLAARTSKYYRRYAGESVDSARIDLVVDVSKAYYSIYTSELQLGILMEDIVRLERSLKDTYNQYQSGIVDKTDYKQATIQLNTARVQYKQASLAIPAKYAYLKQLMGFPVDSALKLQSDSAAMVSEAMLDTTQQLDVNRRVEVQSLLTLKSLSIAQYDYQRLGWLPSLSAFYDYNVYYGNNTFSKLYSQNFPNSYIGLTLGIPIFQGFKRIYAMHAAKLGAELVDLRLEDTKRVINTQFSQAMAAYRGDLENWRVSQENIGLSKEVYATVTLQYKEGIKTYLDVITAEASLRTSEIDGLDALFSLLSDKIDVLKALGTVNTNIN